MVRSLLDVQLEFQHKETAGFLRWPALYDRLPSNHTCRRQFRAAFGVEPRTFMDVSFALYAAVLGREMPILPDWFLPLRASYGEAVDRVCEVLARSELDLRHELQKDRAQKLRGKYELYEFPYVKRFPLVRLKDGPLHTWHRLVFARGIEEAVHLRLSDQFGEKYAMVFSRVYEDYLVELTQDVPGDRLTEGDLKALVGGDMPSVETVLGFSTCNVLIEAKMSLFSDEVLLLDQQDAIFRKTKRIREGIAQGWKVGSLLRTDARFHARFQKTHDYLLVVTSRELLHSGGLMMKELYVDDALTYPDDAAAQRLPLCNVFVLSIEDFEHLTACAAEGLIDLPELLRRAAEANAGGGGQTARLLFSQFLHEAAPHLPRPKFLDAAMQASEHRIVTGLGETM